MLDTKNQVKAFRELSKTGFNAPPSITLASDVSADALLLSDDLSASIRPGQVYPPNTTSSLAKIESTIATLDAAHVAADEFSNYFEKFQTPSELLNISIGWDCYLKAAELDQSLAPQLVAALVDDTIVQGLYDAISDTNTEDVITLMEEVNTALSSTGGLSGGAGAAVSDDLASRLSTACLEMEKRSELITGAISNVVNLSDSGRHSVETSRSSFSNAVSIALLESMSNNQAMSAVLDLITPESVAAALRGIE